jgi:hypothetical protein
MAKNNNDARDTFPTVGDYDRVEDVSGAPWPGAETIARPRMITPPPPGQHVSPRTQRMVDAQSSEKLDEKLRESLSAAAQRRLQFGEAVNRIDDPGERDHLAFLFGLPGPGRDRV